MRRKHGKKKIILIGTCLFFVILFIGVWFENAGRSKTEESKKEKTPVLIPFLIREVLYESQPLYGYIGRGIGFHSPLETYVADMTDSKELKGKLFVFEGSDEIKNTEVKQAASSPTGQAVDSENMELMQRENRHLALFVEDTDFLCAGSGFMSNISLPYISDFTVAEKKSVSYTPAQLRDYSFVLENFYTVDAATSPSGVIENLDEILETDCRIDKNGEGPQILIYHTHSQEGFADSVPGDNTTTIVGAGAHLADLLRREYGYSVYHHTGTYDVDSRDDAYAVAAPALEEILERYPQIQVIIDLHRDGVAENRRLVTEIDGVKMARFMFFNGMSYSNKKGKLDYLPNEHLEGNLAISLKATLAANEYYPGLARTNYLNAYRYNMHYRDKTLLIELGAQTNTVEEIMNSCEPLAHVLDLVLSGEADYS
ncbi:MAG: stage II sporulation protein P [Lachnospiraceae bacterium]|nr:stage II sporulation protein P [Lachnospiraceae bacterium]